MSDFVGGTQVPLVAPATGQADADPNLSYLLAYLKAVCNAHTPAAWAVVNPATAPIVGVFAHDPAEHGFDEKWLPALFAWRSKSDDGSSSAPTGNEWGADQVRTAGIINLRYVPPTQEQAKRRARSTFVRGLFDAINVYIELGRDPAWYLTGDTYPEGDATRTAVYGSVLYHYAKFARLWLKGWEPNALRIAMAKPSPPRVYESYLAQLGFEEWWDQDPTRFDLAVGLDQSITVPADPNDPTHLPEYTLVERIQD